MSTQVKNLKVGDKVRWFAEYAYEWVSGFVYHIDNDCAIIQLDSTDRGRIKLQLTDTVVRYK